MRRIALTFCSLLALAGFVFFASGVGNGSRQTKYWVELDNAFDLTPGGDLKIAGVRAGKLTDIDLDQRTNKALIGFTITQHGFGSLRSDVFCQSRPQSLIGEYYLDCEPGTSRTPLPRTSPSHPIPVSHTASTVPVDLVQDINRAPYAQRFTILLNGLGAALGGNGQNLNDTIRRAVPALRETDQVLGTLASQNRILADLVTQADTVLSDWSANRADVQRWVVSARGTARDTAAEKLALEQGIARLPGFLEQLRPALAALGDVADTNTPALRNLNASATQLRDLFRNLGPFATASTPAFAALGRASITGHQAAEAAVPTVKQLNTFAQGTPELSQNLAIVLQHLDNSAYGVTRDQRAVAQHPITHSDRYSGLEALLQYVFDQVQAISFFDSYGHHLGLSVFTDNNCAPYADAAAARKAPAHCRSWLGPTQPGVTTPDPTKLVPTPASYGASPRARRRSVASAPAQQPDPGSSPASPSAQGDTAPPPAPPGGGSAGQACLLGVCVPEPSVPTGPSALPVGGLTGVGGNAAGGSTPGSESGGGRSPAASQTGNSALLNYLLGP